MWTDDFDARSGDELTLRKGDRISLVELDDGFGDGWYLGKHLAHGNTGLFPGGRSTASYHWSGFVLTSCI
jgi:SH3 domain